MIRKETEDYDDSAPSFPGGDTSDLIRNYLGFNDRRVSENPLRCGISISGELIGHHIETKHDLLDSVYRVGDDLPVVAVLLAQLLGHRVKTEAERMCYYNYVDIDVMVFFL